MNDPKVEIVDVLPKEEQPKVHSKKKQSKIVRHKSVQPDNTLRNSLIAVLVVVFIAVLIFAIMRGSWQKPAEQNIAARFDGGVITVPELDAEYKALPEEMSKLVTKKAYLENVMVPQKILIQKASSISEEQVEMAYKTYLNASMLSEDELSKSLKERGFSVEKFKELVKIQLYLNETLSGKVSVSEDEMKEFYDSYSANLTEEVPAYEDLKADIEDYLKAQKLQLETQNYLEELRKQANVEILYTDSQPVTSTPTAGIAGTFKSSTDEICKENGKPIIRLYSTTWCPHCKWIKETFDSFAKDYVDSGKIAAYHWELDTKDNSLTSEVETDIPASELAVYEKYNPAGSIPTFVFGCKYFRIGNGYEESKDLAAEKAEFVKIIEELIA